MLKQKKSKHLISLSKPPGSSSSLNKQFNYPTSVPSPRSIPQKISDIIPSPKKDDESFLIKRKVMKQNQKNQNSSNYISFINRFSFCSSSLHRKPSINSNSSIKKQLLLSSIDTKDLNTSHHHYNNINNSNQHYRKDNKKYNFNNNNNYHHINNSNINNHSISINNSSINASKKTTTAFNSRINSIERKLNSSKGKHSQNSTNNIMSSNNNSSSNNNNNYAYDKLFEEYAKEKLKKILTCKNSSNSSLINKSKKKTPITSCSSPVNYYKDICINYNFKGNNNNNNINSNSIQITKHNFFNKKKYNKSKSIQLDENKYYSNVNSSKHISIHSNSCAITQHKVKPNENTIHNKTVVTNNINTSIHSLNINNKTMKMHSSAKSSERTAKTKLTKGYINNNYNPKLSLPSSTSSGYINTPLAQKILSSIKLKSNNNFKPLHKIIQHLSSPNSPSKHIISPSKYNSSHKIQSSNAINKSSIVTRSRVQQQVINNNNNSIQNRNRNTIDKLPTNPMMLSTFSSSNINSNYYLAKSNQLAQYIKKYKEQHGEYPDTQLFHYKYGRLIGQGAFGKVNIGLNVLSGRIVAIKSFNKNNLDKNKDSKEKITYETNIMKKLNHSSIVKILEMFESDNYILIIMEYINGGNLYSFVKKRRKLNEKTAKFLFWQITQGIKYMHNNGVVHRDIKLENILIDLNNNVKICDFGIGKAVTPYKNGKTIHILHDQCGTPMYIAPEILLCTKEHGYNAFPVDMWSAGIALYIMLSGTLPFALDKNLNKESHNAELQYAIINNSPKPIEYISEEAQDLLYGLLDKNPKTRYTADDVLKHSWFHNENFNSNPDKYHLFTKAELIMLSKTYIDYRFARVEDIKESFTLSNLKRDDNDNGDASNKNIETKSYILAPYNSKIITRTFNGLDYYFEDEDDDCGSSRYNNELSIQNNVVLFSNKVREYNMNYELNNNGEMDNGILIDPKYDTETQSANDSVFMYEEYKVRPNLKMLSEKKRREYLFKKMEKFGYSEQYVSKCLDKNVLNHATAVYYLMENYEHIE